MYVVHTLNYTKVFEKCIDLYLFRKNYVISFPITLYNLPSLDSIFVRSLILVLASEEVHYASRSPENDALYFAEEIYNNQQL